MKSRMTAVAELLKNKVFNADFGGKERGRFNLDRTDIKMLLNVPRLHDFLIVQLGDALLEVGLVLIDMDDWYGVCEVEYVSKWRKTPARLITEYASELNHKFDEQPDDNKENR